MTQVDRRGRELLKVTQGDRGKGFSKSDRGKGFLKSDRRGMSFFK